MTLTREQRADLYDGHFPALKGEGECPWTPWEPFFLSERFWITPVAVHRSGDRWRIDYKVNDHRDRYLGAAPVISEAERQNRKHWSKDQELGYTGNPRAPLADAGPAVPLEVQEEQSKNGRRKWALYEAQERRDEISRQQLKAINNKVKRLIRDGAELDVDVAPKLAVALKEIEDDIAKAKRAA